MKADTNPCHIFQIQRLSVNDGEGIRSTVFFKGCHLRCHWCANPESWTFEPQLMFLPHKCTSCGNCVEVCSHDACYRDELGQVHFTAAHCRMCGDCFNVCPQQARQVMGKPMTVDQVVAEIRKDYLFYLESGGGVTFSGGEPYLHPEYLTTLVSKCQQLGISTCTESCGLFDFESCKELLQNMDQLFFDIKIMDPIKHHHYTGHDNAVILENICKASQLNSNIVVRVPVIHDVNDDDANMHQLCQFLTQQTSIKRIELLCYHKLGLEKMTALGMMAQVFAPPSEQQLQHLKEIISSFGLENVSYK